MGHTVSRTEQLDPATLLVDVNVRTDVQLDKQFLGTIRDHGANRAESSSSTGATTPSLGPERRRALLLGMVAKRPPRSTGSARGADAYPS
jgi:hypothetical protein